MSTRHATLLAALAAACTTDVGLTESAKCDGVKQAEEQTVDDAFDRDLDGFFDGSNPDCQDHYDEGDLDCNDADEDINPSMVEVPCNGVDDDCDPATPDEGACYDDWSGTWALAQSITYSCAFNNVNVNFNRLLVEDADPSVSVTPVGGGTQPGTMDGSFTSDTEFTASQLLTGSCDEDYQFDGEFISGDELSATLTATFTGTCLGCSYQSWTFTATRQ